MEQRFFTYLYLNLIVIATPFASLKIQIARVNSRTPKKTKPYYSQEKFLECNSG